MRLTRTRSGLILLALAALFLAGLRTTEPKAIPAGLTKAKGGDDGALFKAVVNRVRHGESYYAAMGTELRGRQYPTASVFNWRTPPLYVALAAVPSGGELVTLIALCALALGLTAHYFNKTDLIAEVLVAVVTQAAAVIVMVSPAARFLAETWSGAAIAISILAYARARWIAGAVVALTALFVRELAAPYCIACVLLALHARRMRELYIWIGGLAAYAAFYAVHLLNVQAQQQIGDAAHMNSWVQWGGLAFILETLRETNGVFLLTPHVVLAAALVLLAASLWAPTAPRHVRATVVAYSLFFAVVGLPFNDYWGFLTAPSYALAFAYGVIGVRLLVGNVAARRGAIDSPTATKA